MRLTVCQTMAGEFTMEKIPRAIEDSKKEVLLNFQGIEKNVAHLDIAMTNLAKDDVADALMRIKVLEKDVTTRADKQAC